jgi:hypothetical protein
MSKKTIFITFFVYFVSVSLAAAETSFSIGRPLSSQEDLDVSKGDPRQFTITDGRIENAGERDVYVFKAKNTYGRIVADIKFRMVKNDSGKVEIVPLDAQTSWGYQCFLEVQQSQYNYEKLPGMSSADTGKIPQLVTWRVVSPLHNMSDNVLVQRPLEQTDASGSKGNIEKLINKKIAEGFKQWIRRSVSGRNSGGSQPPSGSSR